MNIQELKIALIKNKIRSSCYAIEQIKYEAWVFERIGGEKWRIFYSEHGLRTGEQLFFSEDEAFRYFLENALRDPMMRDTE